MYLVRYSSRFKKALKKYSRSGRFDRQELQAVVESLARGEILDPAYQDHELSGELAGHRECHIKPDLLLVYRFEDDNLILVLINLGSHSELFE